MRRFVPYLNGWRDVAEPDTLYLWDAAARAGLSYRTYGEFVGTASADDLTALNRGKPKAYPDVSATVAAVAAKQALERNHHPRFRAFDMWTPDAITPASYEAARRSSVRTDPLITGDHPDARFRGTSRMGVWLDEFREYVSDLEAGRGDRLPALSILHLPNDHTDTVGITPGLPTPQFHMADNDYALGRLADAVSHSPYWRNTAILVVEDDAQDGPDHVDAHRSVALVISAYNRRGALVHEMHNTVSLIRTLELLLGLPPMNQLDAAAAPMAIFQEQPDLDPYVARLPAVVRAEDRARAGLGARDREARADDARRGAPARAERGHLVLGAGRYTADAAAAAVCRLRCHARDDRRGARRGRASAALDGATGAGSSSLGTPVTATPDCPAGPAT
jgi:hypothetical protein